MRNVRQEMMQLLGEEPEAGTPSTGGSNKPAKKTQSPSVAPPNVKMSPNKGGSASATSTPSTGANKQPKKTPKADVAPPNVTGAVNGGKPAKNTVAPPNVTGSKGNAVENAIDDMKRLARIYAGIDSKYELQAGEISSPHREPAQREVREDREESDDPILKFAREGLRETTRHHPFE